jgi:hypothetical protein
MTRKLLLAVPALFMTAAAFAQSPPASTLKPLSVQGIVQTSTSKAIAAACPPLKTSTRGADMCPGEGTCPRWGNKSDPLTWRSNLCVNKALNMFVKDAKGQPVTYDGFFGDLDCRAGGVRDLKSISKFVVHNGGYNAGGIKSHFTCAGVAAHYTIERDGRIVQLIGEERLVYHANQWNDESIGVELNIEQFTFGGRRWSCNQSHEAGLRASNPEHRKIVQAACAPTAAQYASLRSLISAVAARTSVTIDKEHIVGHCENGAGHGDPKAFDWREIGISNKEKRDSLKKGNDCDFYNVYD